MLFGLPYTNYVEYLAFLSVAGLTLLGGLGTIVARRVFPACLWLLVCLGGVAGLYALLAGHLLMAVQILVYAGAITVLIIFAVMLLQRHTGRIIMAENQHLIGGVLAAGFMATLILVGIFTTRYQPLAFGDTPATFAGDNVKLIGHLLLTKYLLPFEVVSVVLLASMIGALVLARQEPGENPGAAEAPEAESQP
ncbi:MAG: NADH-quinone oxidoreductase subunit J [Armatimonadetes bacterium]|nr:NADH-quinone oxidoreductase subunit J [Armatimonadota bacterium]